MKTRIGDILNRLGGSEYAEHLYTDPMYRDQDGVSRLGVHTLKWKRHGSTEWLYVTTLRDSERVLPVAYWEGSACEERAKLGHEYWVHQSGVLGNGDEVLAYSFIGSRERDYKKIVLA
jgi:hypothetical protein